MENFSHRLKEAVRLSGQTKGEIALALGVPQSSLSRWLGGMEPKAERVSDLAKILGVDVKWLIDGLSTEAKSAVVQGDVTPYRAQPLRPSGEPSILERLERMEAHNQAMHETMEAMRGALDELTDLFTSRRPTKGNDLKE